MSIHKHSTKQHTHTGNMNHKNKRHSYNEMDTMDIDVEQRYETDINKSDKGY